MIYSIAISAKDRNQMEEVMRKRQQKKNKKKRLLVMNKAIRNNISFKLLFKRPSGKILAFDPKTFWNPKGRCSTNDFVFAPSARGMSACPAIYMTRMPPQITVAECAAPSTVAALRALART